MDELICPLGKVCRFSSVLLPAGCASSGSHAFWLFERNADVEHLFIGVNKNRQYNPFFCLLSIRKHLFGI